MMERCENQRRTPSQLLGFTRGLLGIKPFIILESSGVSGVPVFRFALAHAKPAR